MRTWQSSTFFPHYRNRNGRYVVKLPINSELHSLGASKPQALKRFLSLEKRLEGNLQLKQEYHDFINEYINLGHMHPAPTSNDSITYYIPHHPVFKPSSSTTKLRVVFDASAKSSTGVSLNDTLLNGSKIQDDLFDLLLKFRIHKYAIVADLKMMFRQIKVDPSDHNLQRILWRDSPPDPYMNLY